MQRRRLRTVGHRACAAAGQDPVPADPVRTYGDMFRPESHALERFTRVHHAHRWNVVLQYDESIELIRVRQVDGEGKDEPVRRDPYGPAVAPLGAAGLETLDE